MARKKAKNDLKVTYTSTAEATSNTETCRTGYKGN